jgi:hypothetical protein
VVRKAIDTTLDREVAIKVLLPGVVCAVDVARLDVWIADGLGG